MPLPDCKRWRILVVTAGHETSPQNPQQNRCNRETVNLRSYPRIAGGRQVHPVPLCQDGESAPPAVQVWPGNAAVSPGRSWTGPRAPLVTRPHLPLCDTAERGAPLRRRQELTTLSYQVQSCEPVSIATGAEPGDIPRITPGVPTMPIPAPSGLRAEWEGPPNEGFPKHARLRRPTGKPRPTSV